MNDQPGRAIERVETGVPNLDAILGGGLPRGSVTIVMGPPGSGKTILAEQISFHHATPLSRALYFNTLGEPTAKTLRYLQQFSFFDGAKLAGDLPPVQFVDLGAILRTKGLENAAAMIVEHMKRVQPAFVAIDTFKVFDDLASSPEELRKFTYEIAVSLMAWECTAFLLGEYGPEESRTNPSFSIVDGLISLDERPIARVLRVAKMRGTDHSRDEHPFRITDRGIEVLSSEARPPARG